jgi:mono/diheme cytochrome c family protein
MNQGSSRRRWWPRLLVGTVVTLVLLAGAGVILVEARWKRRFEAPYPAIAATHDPALVSRGEYLVYSAAACAYCHVPREDWSRLDRGERLPLTGNHVFRLPFGEIYSANLTPHSPTGIGTRTDAELARILRYGVRADGRAAFPLMEIQLSDDDLTAVVSYLRSQPGLPLAVPDHRFTRFGKALMAFAIAPVSPPGVPESSPPGATVERGAYLANNVSSCVSCHTNRGSDGALVGPPFGGGQRMDVAADPTRVYVSPNLTPDAETSPIGAWSEDTFVARFKLGELFPGTPMPWGAFKRLTDDDIRAIYRYLRTLPPTRNPTGPAVQPRTP